MLLAEVGAWKRTLARKQLESHYPKRVHVTGGRRALKSPLLCCCVGLGHEELASVRCRGGFRVAGNSEIGERPMAAIQQDVLWLQIAVNNTAQAGKRVRNVDQYADR